MSAESIIMKSACVGVGGVIMGFQGLKKMFSAGHSVANGVRKVADGIDAVSDWGEKKCDTGIDYCTLVQGEYEAELETIETIGVDAAVEQKKNKGYKTFEFNTCKEEDNIIDVIPSAVGTTSQQTTA